MENLSLKEIANLVVENRLSIEEYLVTKTDRALTYKVGDRYIKCLIPKKYNSKKNKKKFVGSLNSIKKSIEKLNENGIFTYEIVDSLTVNSSSNMYEFYETKEVKGKHYKEIENSDFSLYMSALRQAVRMMKIGFYRYDFHAGNFFINKEGQIVFIDLDELKSKSIKNFLKTLMVYRNRLMKECVGCNFSFSKYEDEFYTIIEEELEIKKNRIKCIIKAYLKYTKFVENIRKTKRKILGKK